jgi:hypothetical protein
MANEDSTEGLQGSGGFYISVPKSIPLGIIMAIVIQIGVVIWGISSFYKENQLMKEGIFDQFKGLQDEISSIKASIYTRQEAVVLQSQLEKIENRVTFIEHEGYKVGKPGTEPLPSRDKIR